MYVQYMLNPSREEWWYLDQTMKVLVNDGVII